MQKHQRFGWVISNMFKVMFSNFRANMIVAAGLFLISVLMAVPYGISLGALSLRPGYPFAVYNSANAISLILGMVLMSIGLYAVVPALSAGYFAPKTADYLAGRTRENSERRQIMLNSFGRVTAAAVCQFLILIIPAALAVAAMLPVIRDISLENALYQYDKYAILILIYIAAILISIVLGLLSLFTRHVAFFENTTGFRAVFRSFRLMLSKNFWPTLGEFIVIRLILSAGVNILILPGILIVIPIVSFVTLLSTVSTVVIIMIYVLLGLVGLALIVFIFGLAYSGYEIAASCLYFNARARTEGIPIPGAESE